MKKAWNKRHKDYAENVQNISDNPPPSIRNKVLSPDLFLSHSFSSTSSRSLVSIALFQLTYCI
jgi:hypothetical protein